MPISTKIKLNYNSNHNNHWKISQRRKLIAMQKIMHSSCNIIIHASLLAWTVMVTVWATTIVSNNSSNNNQNLKTHKAQTIKIKKKPITKKKMKINMIKRVIQALFSSLMKKKRNQITAMMNTVIWCSSFPCTNVV